MRDTSEPRERCFYHGTSWAAAAAIRDQGFRVWFRDDDVGRYASGGNLGTGIYITQSPKVAAWFGPALLRVELRRGTRLLNAAVPPRLRDLDSLRREFGREILQRPPWKVVPRNKRLKRAEVIALLRYHYGNAWEREYAEDRDGIPRWPRRRELHARLSRDFRSMLMRHGYHGFGNPEDDNGIVVFAEDRLIVRS